MNLPNVNHMKNIFATVASTLICLALIALIFIYAGWVNIAADVPHNPIVFSVLEIARERAIQRDASLVSVPSDISDPERVRRGSGNYDAMCVNCHLSPGQNNSEIRLGLYPTPPNLTEKEQGVNFSQQSKIRFWVIKHGIKASGMPAWSKGGMSDQEIWDLVSFLQQLPEMDEHRYRILVHTSDGHHHEGINHPHDLSNQHHHETDMHQK